MVLLRQMKMAPSIGLEKLAALTQMVFRAHQEIAVLVAIRLATLL
jgi:hypothetical protein